MIWIALIGCVAFGPVTLALTPPPVAHRVARTDRIAAQRFESLKNAAEQAAIEAGDSDSICAGSVLKPHYFGPTFSEGDWRYIAGNYVMHDGYAFGIWCHQQGGYTIDAYPLRIKGDGTRRFCADESGKVGCGIEWNRSRMACLPCTK